MADDTNSIIENAPLNREWGKPTFFITFGHKAIGGYRLFLRSPTNNELGMFGDGTKAELIAKPEVVPMAAKDLDQHYVTIDTIITDVDDEPGGFFSVNVLITQKDPGTGKNVAVFSHSFPGDLDSDGDAAPVYYITFSL